MWLSELLLKHILAQTHPVHTRPDEIKLMQHVVPPNKEPSTMAKRLPICLINMQQLYVRVRPLNPPAAEAPTHTHTHGLQQQLQSVWSSCPSKLTVPRMVWLWSPPSRTHGASEDDLQERWNHHHAGSLWGNQESTMTSSSIRSDPRRRQLVCSLNRAADS